MFIVDRRRAAIGLGAGLATTVIVAAGIIHVLPAFSVAVRSHDSSGAQMAWCWAGVIGVVLGASAIGGARYSPLVSGVPAVLLFALFLPRLVSTPPVTPDWVPSFLAKVVFWGYDPVAALVVGVLAVSTVWGVIDRDR